jgi:membrane protease YdiL (CAAX protease family)
MFPVVLYVLICYILGGMSWALHWGSQSQVLVLFMGLAVFPLQKFIHRAPISELGFRRCTWGQMGRGLFLPLVILGSVAAIDLLSGAAQLLPLTTLHNPFSGSPVGTISGLAWFLALNAAILFVLEFVTEELMFRGYILGKLTMLGETRGLVIASALFGLWHVPIAIWGVGPDAVRTPLYVINMMLLGAVLGLLFLDSRSLIPVAAFHALWNSIEYNLFGFMDQRALLIGASRLLFDPEEGCVGTIVLALTVAALLARRYRLRPAMEKQTDVPAIAEW